MELTFESVGLQKTVDGIRKLPDATKRSSAYAINRAITSARSESIDLIRRQLNFPSNYFGSTTDNNARLAITEKASPDRLEGRISARRRATSLSRFSEIGSNGRDVRVAVKAGKTPTILKGAFPLRLRSGTSLDEAKYNRGIAYRARPGETLLGSRGARLIGNNLYLLYGPSVDQAFQTVIPSITPDAERVLRQEFFRQLDRLGVF